MRECGAELINDSRPAVITAKNFSYVAIMIGLRLKPVDGLPPTASLHQRRPLHRPIQSFYILCQTPYNQCRLRPRGIACTGGSSKFVSCDLVQRQQTELPVLFLQHLHLPDHVPTGPDRGPTANADDVTISAKYAGRLLETMAQAKPKETDTSSGIKIRAPLLRAVRSPRSKG